MLALDQGATTLQKFGCRFALAGGQEVETPLKTMTASNIHWLHGGKPHILLAVILNMYYMLLKSRVALEGCGINVHSW